MLFAFTLSHSANGEVNVQQEKGFYPTSCDICALTF